MDKLFLPHTLVILVTVLAASFCLVVVVSVEKKKREPHYAPIFAPGRPNGHDRRESSAMNYSSQQRYQGSYQHQYQQQTYNNHMSGGYAIPSKHKDITYCVIDERLVDN